MGNYTSSPIYLSSKQRKITLVFTLRPTEASHKLDSSYNNRFSLKEHSRLSCDPCSGFVEVIDGGGEGKVEFSLLMGNKDENIDDDELEMTLELMAQQTPLMVGTPCMIRNSVKLPIRFDYSAPFEEKKEIDLTCRFN